MLADNRNYIAAFSKHAGVSGLSGTFEETVDLVSCAHLHWKYSSFDKLAPTALQERRVNGTRFVRACVGLYRACRGPTEISLDSDAYLAVSLIKRGHGITANVRGDILCSPGDIVIWRSAENASVEATRGPTDCFTVFLPEERLDTSFSRAIPCAGMPLKGGGGFSTLVAAYLSALADNFADADMEDAQADASAEITIDLIAATIAGCRSQNVSSSRTVQWKRILRFIEWRLEDPELNPAMIANANGVSLRQIYRLFAEQGHTVAGWIRSRRLERCRAELANSHDRITVTEIAFRWGFNDIAHFSRAFKSFYGLSPRAFRQTTARTNE